MSNMSTNGSNFPLPSRSFFEDQSFFGWVQLTDRWYLVRNGINPSYEGSKLGRCFCQLVYLPNKTIFDAGHKEEMAHANSVKKRIYASLILGGCGLTGLAIIVIYGLIKRLDESTRP